LKAADFGTTRLESCVTPSSGFLTRILAAALNGKRALRWPPEFFTSYCLLAGTTPDLLTLSAFSASIGTDRGEAMVGAMVAHLRQNSILLPSAAVLEKIALVERARARKQAYKELTAGVDDTVREKLEALICVADEEARTPLAWLREWPEAPVQKNLAGIVQRLQSVRAIGVEPDRERRIHRARYVAIARETAILSAQHLHRFDYQRRLATLVVFAREMEAELTDAALTMLGSR
jgi:hypothetical protein